MIADEDRRWLDVALDQARQGWAEDGIPIGAALVHEGRLLAAGRNRRVQLGSAILHGETDAIERAGRRPAATYQRSVLYTTLSPCHMCAGTVLLYGIPRVVIGENRTFTVAEGLLRSHGVTVEVVDDLECRALMERLLAERPTLWAEDIGVDPVR
ncbi:cytosine deaminase [Intrasporangium chromatireducens Q5-1]|uniref:Cytosine deaminase n=1 Tax=Intrasporangium chromatireducens Q5-1 TaxID=584657 RepID=W9GQV5_9MICO|nr:nucleoside deaminase [Intrasporangium chromatireducens]EWT07213.1 cytosine deaminase [Intrasporangium chromatireducens Q5-1]